MPRCPDCQKFRSMELQEPEVGDLTLVAEIAEGGDVEVTVSCQDIHISRACTECSTEMKTADLEADHSFTLAHSEVEKHLEQKEDGTWQFRDECELEVHEDGTEGTERTEGKGRGLKSFFGANVSFHVSCACDIDTQLYEGTLEADVQASAMEEAC